MSFKTVSILLIDDDEVDVLAFKRVLRSFKIANPVFVARDGVDGLAMLRGEQGYDPVPRPYIILLDINMPRMSGLEFLDVLRSQEDVRSSIVFVLTTSREDEDRVAAYQHNVAGYIVKSEIGDGFLRAVEMLDHYWRVIEFP